MSTFPINIPTNNTTEFPTHKNFLPKRRRSLSYPTPPDKKICNLIEQLKRPTLNIKDYENKK